MGLEIDFTKQDQAHQLSKRWLFSKKTKTKTKTTKGQTPPVKATGSVGGEASVEIVKDKDGWTVKIGGKIEAEGTVEVDNGGSKSGKKSTGGSSSSGGGGGGWWRRR